MAGYNHFPEIAGRLPSVLSRMVRKTALDIQAQAQVGAPVDTGFLRASIYTVTSRSSNYGKGRASGTPNVAKALHQELLPEVAAPEDNYTAYVAVGAYYGVFVELGTRHMAAQPYFYPAVDAGQAALEEAAAAIESQLGIDLGALVEGSEV